jgi:hypothetical protein
MRAAMSPILGGEDERSLNPPPGGHALTLAELEELAIARQVAAKLQARQRSRADAQESEFCSVV